MAEVNNSIEFLPGFTNFQGTRPGTFIEDKKYRLTFVKCNAMCNDERSTLVSQGFERCYAWDKVMNILLLSLENYQGVENLKVARDDLRKWFLTYKGWGLLSALLPRQQHIVSEQALSNIKQNWPMEKEYNEKVCWEVFAQDVDWEAMIPEFEVTIEKGNFGYEAWRKKWMNLRLSADKWQLEAKFVATKHKMGKENLVAIAARAIAKHLENTEDIEDLEIPRDLRKPIAQMMEDIRWSSNQKKRGTKNRGYCGSATRKASH